MRRRPSIWMLLFVTLAGIFIAGWFALSWLNRAREGAHLSCSMNMRQLELAIELYAKDNAGHYPDRLTDLMITEDITAAIFVCPNSADESAPGKTIQEQIDSINARGFPKRLHDPANIQAYYCSYIYLGKGLMTPVPKDQVILYEPLTNHDGDGTNVLFGDGHVQWLTRTEAEKTIVESAQ